MLEKTLLNALEAYRRGIRIEGGISWKDVTSDAGTLFAIGLSREATEQGFEYAAMISMHEL